MFDLEKALAAWRRSLTFNRNFQPEDVDELERHLRDQVRDLASEGMTEEEAFRTARAQFGQYGDVEKEYRKVRWESLSARGRTLEELGARWAMLVSYVFLALRSFRRYPLYFGLNLAGLAIGMAAALLIMLFIQHERSYDSFHSGADRIYRVVQKANTTYTSAMLAPSLLNDFIDVESSLRISERWFKVRVRSEQLINTEHRFFFADSTFFSVMGYPLMRGEAGSVLTAPFTVVLTESTARKYFGDEDPIGRTLNIKGLWDAYDFQVTGVAADMQGNSHFQFDFVASFDTRFQAGESRERIETWFSVGDRSYIKLREGASIDSVQAGMVAFANRNFPARVQRMDAEKVPEIYAFQPISEIHLESDLENEFGPNGDTRTLSIFAWVAVLILVVAWLNYINMATARTVARAREVGVRKVVGAARKQLVTQFLVESAMMMLLAGVLALSIATVALPAFGNMTGRMLAPGTLLGGELMIVWFSMLVLGVLLAGSLPAWSLSSLRPTQVIKGLVGSGGSNAGFRKGLVFVQFALSVMLLFGTSVMQRQLTFLQETRLGSNPDHVLVIENDRVFDSRTDDVFKDRLAAHSGVISVSSMESEIPLNTDMTMQLLAERPQGLPSEEVMKKSVYHTMVDHRFLETMQIKLLDGRDFTPVESTQEIDRSYLPTILNQKAVQVLGWEDPLGREFACCFARTPRVVGIMEDFHFESVKEEVKPLAISPAWGSFRILVRVQPERTADVIEYMTDVWEEMAPEWPLEWAFMNDKFAAAYTAEQRLANSFRLFTVLGTLIACLGLFGLATLVVQSRVREIGIRKAVGASAIQVATMVMGDLMRPISYAILVALPVAAWLARRWLEDFPYRIGLETPMFTWIIVITILVAGLTLSLHTWRAARINPADAIRYE